MHAIQRDFTKIINGTTQFTIPVFQRDYTWTEANCEQLWKEEHVRGPGIESERALPRIFRLRSNRSICCRFHTVSSNRWSTAPYHLDADDDCAAGSYGLSAFFKGNDDGPTTKRINAYYLRNEQEEGARRYKLVSADMTRRPSVG